MNGFALRGVGAKSCVAVGLALVGIVAIADRPSIAAPEKERERVSASDLGSTIDVIGTLGVPLGKLVTIEGRVARGDVFGSKGLTEWPVVFVERIDEKAVPPTTWIRLRPYGPGGNRYGDVKPGTRCRLLGFETGGFMGSPKGAMESYGVEFQDFSWHFNTRFEIVKAIATKKDDLKKPYPKVPDGQ